MRPDDTVMDGMSLDLKKPGFHRVCVTPQVAAYWLTFRREHQRDISSVNLGNLLRKYDDGSWRHDHTDPIVFSVLPDGRVSLDEGQHTLTVVCTRQFSTFKYVHTGADPKLFGYLGCSLRRRHFERYRVLGTPAENRVFHTAVSAARLVVKNHCSQMTDAELVTWCDAYREGLEYAMQWRSAEPGVSRGPVLAACAEYAAMRGPGAEPFFRSVYRADGPSQPGRMLRDLMLRSQHLSGGMHGSLRAYRLSVSAAIADYEGRHVDVLRPREDWTPGLLKLMPAAMRDLRR